MGIFFSQFSRWRLTKVERRGFFMLFTLLTIALILESRPKAKISGSVSLSSSEVKTWLLVRDSMLREQTKSRAQIFPFNPNFISPAKADRLELSAAEFKRLNEYRKTGNWINSSEDFQRITGVSSSWMAQYSDLFKFPEFLKSRPERKIQSVEKISFGQATPQDLTKIKGIGPIIAERIIRARDKWGGIGSAQELMMIYGMTPSLKESLLGNFLLDKKSVSPRNINTLFPSDLSEIPGINFDLAKDIWAFVRLRQGLNDLEELHLLDEIPPRLFEVIKLYLYAMKNEPKEP